MYEGFYDVLIYPLQGILRTVHIIDLLYLHPRNIIDLVRNLIAILINVPSIKYRFVLWIKLNHRSLLASLVPHPSSRTSLSSSRT